METIYLGIVLFLFVLAIFDLVVGVSNDAVNFLNSAIGAKAASFKTIIFIAGVGVFIGAALSNGMMDIARHGIYQPQHFYFAEIMCILLAVMLTDVVLLDVFNTMGMPTSTTVSMVFELLGGTFALSLIKVYSSEGTLGLGDLINTDKALSVIMAIFVSVAIAFFFGMLVQWLARIIFTFNYKKHMKYSIGIFGGIAATSIIYFMLIKGLKDSSFMTPEYNHWIQAHTLELVGAFFVMYLADFSINILTLLAIVLAIGLVVDDAIVVMENIYSKIEQGMSPLEAGHKGSEEIFFAVIATTVALVAVFVPIVFLEGTTGRLFREFSIVIAGAVIISAFVALTFTPMITTKMVSRNTTSGWFYRKTEPLFEGMIRGYAKALKAFMKRRWLAPVILLVSGVVIVVLWAKLPSEMAPLEDRSNIRINSTAPEGATFAYMSRYADELSTFVESAVPEQDKIIQMIGGGNTNRGNINLWLKDPDDRERTQQEIADELAIQVRNFTGARTMVSQQQTFGNQRGGLPVEYVIQAKNLDDLKRVLPKFMEEVNKSPVFSVADANLKFTKPELTITIDRDKAAVLGVSVQNIAQTLQLTMSEQRVGYFILNGKQYEILSEIDKAYRSKPADLQNIYVRNDEGKLIPLDNLVTMEEGSMPPQLYRYDRFVAATVSAGLARHQTLSQGLEEMDRIADEVLDDNFKTTLSGSSKDFVESSSSLLFAFTLALIFIYLVLAAQFESFRDPLIVMLTVPLALIGALVALWYFDQTMNIFSQIGIIMLIGLVSKNGILIVEFANQRKAMGQSKMDAVMHSAEARFRPILMTSLATVLGILPMAIATGAGSESRVAMGIAVVGGMICATFLSLFVVPAIYSYLSTEKAAVTEIEEEHKE